MSAATTTSAAPIDSTRPASAPAPTAQISRPPQHTRLTPEVDAALHRLSRTVQTALARVEANKSDGGRGDVS